MNNTYLNRALVVSLNENHQNINLRRSEKMSPHLEEPHKKKPISLNSFNGVFDEGLVGCSIILSFMAFFSDSAPCVVNTKE